MAHTEPEPQPSPRAPGGYYLTSLSASLALLSGLTEAHALPLSPSQELQRSLSLWEQRRLPATHCFQVTGLARLGGHPVSSGTSPPSPSETQERRGKGKGSLASSGDRRRRIRNICPSQPFRMVHSTRGQCSGGPQSSQKLKRDHYYAHFTDEETEM